MMRQVSTDASRSSVADARPERPTQGFRPTAPAEAARWLAEFYGIEGTALRLSSELDETFAVTAADGRRLVLKLASPAERRDVLEFQDGALLHLETNAPHLPVPRLVPSRTGERCLTLAAGGSVRFIRLLTYLEGRQIWEVPASASQLANLGQAVGQLDRALASYRPKVPDVDLLWDVSRADRLGPMLDDISDPERRRMAGAILESFRAEIGPIGPLLPRQVIHNDVNPYNILVDAADADLITGIIDFGDLIEAPRINNVAIALSYHVGKRGGFELVHAFIAGYRRQVELEQMELDALGILVKTRLAMTIVITEWRAKQRPDHARYILRNHPASLAGLEALRDLSPQQMRELFDGGRA